VALNDPESDDDEYRGAVDVNGTPLSPVEAQRKAALYRADATATERLGEMEDTEHGPFACGTRWPLVYTFADGEEERGFIEFARELTHTSRRDVRVGTALLMWACFAFGAATSVSDAGIALLFLAATVQTFDAAFLCMGRGVQSDTPLAHTALFLFLAALIAADGNAIGNDPFWALQLYLLAVVFTTWTLSPLVRTALCFAYNVASFAKLAVLREGHLLENAGMAVAVAVAVPVLTALAERFARRAFVERRLVETLIAQQRAARAAQTAMVRAVVPADIVRPLQVSLAAGGCNMNAVVAHYDRCAIAGIQISPPFDVADKQQHTPSSSSHFPSRVSLPSSRPGASFRLGGATAPSESLAAKPMSSHVATTAWLVDVHRALDAVLGSVSVVEKVKTIGDTALLWAPLPDDCEASYLAGACIAELVFVVQSLHQLSAVVAAAVHLGPVTGAVLGTERLSFDVTGPTTREAERALAAHWREVTKTTTDALQRTSIAVTSAVVKCLDPGKASACRVDADDSANVPETRALRPFDLRIPAFDASEVGTLASSTRTSASANDFTSMRVERALTARGYPPVFVAQAPDEKPSM